MPDDRTATFVLPGLWTQIKAIRHEVKDMLRDYGDQVESSAAVAVTELVENAVKYGSSVGNNAGVVVEVRVSRGQLVIRVSNSVDNPSSVERLLQHVAQLESGGDPVEAFQRRLEELSQGRTESTGLGVFRVAAEGGFYIKTEVADSVVTVVATRDLEPGG